MADDGGVLPILDLADADADPDAFRTALREAAHGYGFFYLTGHGVPASSAPRCSGWPGSSSRCQAPPKMRSANSKARSSAAIRDWAANSPTARSTGASRSTSAPNARSSPDARGYWRLQGPNLWPSALPALRAVFERWDAALSGVGLRLLRHWAVSLGAAENVFDAAFADRPATLIKVVRYPGTADTRPGRRRAQGFGCADAAAGGAGVAGTAGGAAPGRVDRRAAGAGAFIVNIGELLEVATGGYLRATQHRVSAPEPGADRVSVPFFLNPALDALVPDHHLAPGTGRPLTRRRSRPEQPDLQHLRGERLEVAHPGPPRCRRIAPRHPADGCRRRVLIALPPPDRNPGCAGRRT